MIPSKPSFSSMFLLPSSPSLAALFFTVAIVGFFLVLPLHSAPSSFNVSYDHRSLIINGQHRILISGSIHYPRSTPEMWPHLIAKAKEGGVDVIETYVFWDQHEPAKGKYNFEGRRDLVRFVKEVQNAGLFLNLRIGPYISAEWNFGGLPVWLHLEPYVVFRTDNVPFKAHMQNFVKKIITMMKDEKLFAWQGGPIILAQIENEFGTWQNGTPEHAYSMWAPKMAVSMNTGVPWIMCLQVDAPDPVVRNVEYYLGFNAWQGGPIILAQIENEFGTWQNGTPEHAYSMWAPKMAVSMNTGVPWIMCLQVDAPDPVINTYNKYYADDFYPNRDYKPKMWTENWTGWFQSYGKPTPYRPVEDLAFAVLRFFQKNGSFQNYYMYHGGTNFGRTAGGPFITTTYDYDAPLDEYGLIRQPKWGHLKDMHQALKLCEPAMVSGDATIYMYLGSNKEVYVYSNETDHCAAFISNSDAAKATVQFNGNSYDLPGWSVSVLPDCRNVAFNSAKISSQTSIMAMKTSQNFSELKWQWYSENPGNWSQKFITDTRLIEQTSIVKDQSDYLWYTTSLQVSEDEPFLVNGSNPTLIIDSMRDAVHVFINSEWIVTAQGEWGSPSVQVVQRIKLHAGTNEISILSMTVGLQTGGSGYDLAGTGIQGSVYVDGFKNGTLDLSTQQWIHEVGVKGEALNIYAPDGTENVAWSSGPLLPKNRPLTWYKAYFDAPIGDDPVALDLSSMGKGQAWVNGESIGRFWPSYVVPSDSCTGGCDYRGEFSSTKCVTNCGEPSQRWYHVPRSWLRPTNNLLVLFEEVGGDPELTSVVVRVIDTICGYIGEDYPPPLSEWSSNSGNVSSPQLNLECGKGQTIESLTFASFGTPTGQCGNFERGLCHAPLSLEMLEQRCLGQTKCSVSVSSSMFGADPCPERLKSLAVEAKCSLTTTL